MIGALLGAVASMAPSAMQFVGQQQTNKENKEMAREQMGYQTDMSNTAHQREIEDLKKAGLNPILSSKYGGSSTPSGSISTMVNPAGGLSSDVTSAVSTGLNALRLKNDIATMKTQQTLNQSTAQKNLQDARLQKAFADYRESPLGRKMIPIADILGTARQASDAVSNLIPRPKINVTPKF